MRFMMARGTARSSSKLTYGKVCSSKDSSLRNQQSECDGKIIVMK